MKFKVDENLPIEVAEILRTAGYDAMTVRGLTLAQGVTETVQKTTNIYDVSTVPMPSLMKIYSDAQTNGLARAAYYYVTRDAGVTDSMMGVATNSLNYNVVFLGVDWRHMPHSAVNTGSERIIRAIVEFIERSSGIVVPVELSSFDATRMGADVKLDWATASEKNASHFEVERAEVSDKGTSPYAKIQTVLAQGTSSVVRDYSTVDPAVSTRSAWSYRLKMVDLDGSSRYSNDVLIAAEAGDASSINASPNPATNLVKVNLTLAGSGMTEVTLVDLAGHTVRSIAHADLSGKQTFDVTIDDLASGIYTIVVKQNGIMTSQTLQIVK